MQRGLAKGTGVFVASLVLTIMVVSLAGYYELGAKAPNCVVTGVGGFGVQVLSDSMGTPASVESIIAMDALACDIVGHPAQTQVVKISSFSSGQGGWLTPVFPAQAEAGGQLNFTVVYQGRTYNFSAEIPPIGTNCVTLHVPSGNVTTASVMNGQGSYCWQ